MTTEERETAREYDRWMKQPGPMSASMRFLMGPVGQFFINTPAFRLPDELDFNANQRVLDVGCGSASLLRTFATRVGFSQPPVGLDISKTMLGMAQARQDEETPLHLVEGTATNLPFADRSFDVILSGHVVKHLTDSGLLAAFREMYRVLTPGGLAVVWEFAPVTSPTIDRWNRWVVTRGVTSARFRTYGRLAAAAKRAGFEFTGDAELRPFLYPPIPRASLLMGKAPEGWES